MNYHLKQSMTPGSWLGLALRLVLLAAAPQAQAQLSAKEIIQKADELTRGQKSHAVMRMTVVRPSYTRTVDFKTWSLGRDYALTYITDPVRDKGQSFLKHKTEMWNWQPRIERMIKMSPSMLAQGWMGSDYSNDDLLRESSMVEDYTHELLGSQDIAGLACHKIKLVPKPDAPVVWGHILLWISKEGFMQMRGEYYDEYGELVRTEAASEVRELGGRRMPSHIEIVPADQPGHKTLIDIQSMDFAPAIDESFFSQQNMRRPQ